MSLKSIFMGLLAIALCMAGAVAQDSSLRVTGVGYVQTSADTAIIAVSVQNSSNNSTLAKQANSLVLNSAEKSMISAGVKSEEIMKNRPKGYVAYHGWICNTANNITSCKDVVMTIATEKMIVKLKTADQGRIDTALSAAESAGANATVIGYALNDSSQAYKQARVKAIENAKTKAEDYASAFGYKLGDAISIEDAAYPDIEMGPSYGFDRSWSMGNIWGMDSSWMGRSMIWPHSSSLMNDWMMDYPSEDYIPSGKAKVTAYVSVQYKATMA